MPAVLREHQHEILDVAETGGLVFGTEDTGYLTLERPIYTSADLRVGDIDRVAEDGRAFGRDFLGSKTTTFTMGVITDKLNGLDGGDAHRANLNALDRLENWWRDPRWRNDPSAVAVLRSCEAGQTWRAYGRPRRYEDTPGKFTQLGYTPLVCDFALIDDCYYSDAIYSVTTGLVPSSDGGLIAPLVAPLTTVPETEGNTVVEIGGSRMTWPWVTFTGPVTNPSVVLGNAIYIGINGTLLNGQSITVDPRPWRRTVLRENGGSVAGSLNPATPQMKNIRLRPGQYEVKFRGIDITATSRCTVYWRDARSRP
jgi:hypothetical protein